MQYTKFMNDGDVDDKNLFDPKEIVFSCFDLWSEDKKHLKIARFNDPLICTTNLFKVPMYIWEVPK